MKTKESACVPVKLQPQKSHGDNLCSPAAGPQFTDPWTTRRALHVFPFHPAQSYAIATKLNQIEYQHTFSLGNSRTPNSPFTSTVP